MVANNTFVHEQESYLFFGREFPVISNSFVWRFRTHCVLKLFSITTSYSAEVLASWCQERRARVVLGSPKAVVSLSDCALYTGTYLHNVL